MNYSKNILANIGRVVVSKHPDIAQSIINQVEENIGIQKEAIQFMFERYCKMMGIKDSELTGPVFKSRFTEIRKIFISVIISFYGDRRRLNKILSDILQQLSSLMSRQISEVKFRYKRDADFMDKCNKAIQCLQKPIN